MSVLKKNKEYYTNISGTAGKVNEEINTGLALLNSIDKEIVAFFGSHRVDQKSTYYKHCENLAFELGKRGFAVLSGGGTGIMHAANSGATRANVPSIGFKAELLKGEKVTDDIFTHQLSFHFLFARRFLMAIKSEALIFYPGGYGTINELFEYAVLMQTGIVDRVPIVCVNRKYWEGLFKWMQHNPLKENFFIHDAKDLELLHFVDTAEEVLALLKK